MDFDTWLQNKNITGRIPRQAAIKLQDAWMKDTREAGGFKPEMGSITNASTGAVEDYMTTSANSAQLLRDPRPAIKPYVGKDGKLYAVDPASRSAAVITNTDGSPFLPDPKANRFDAIDQMMGGSNGGQAEPEAQGGGLFSGWFGAKPSPSPTPAPTATPAPVQRPAPQQAATPATSPTPTPAQFSQGDFERQFGAKLEPGKYDYDGQLVIITK